MNARTALLLGPAVLSLSVAAGLAQPLARVTFSNFNDLSNAVVRVVSAASPGLQDTLGTNLMGKLGLVDLSTFDPKGSWELAVWKPTDSPTPLLALKCPAPDVKKFRSKLSDGSLLAGMGQEWIQLDKAGAAIVFKAAGDQTDTEKSELKRWEAEALVPPKRLAQLTLTPSEELRAQILPFLSIARMSMTQSAATASGGANPKATGDFFNLYFDGIEAFIEGLQDLKLSLNVTSEAIMVQETVSAKPGTAFAAWIHKPVSAIRAEDLKFVDPDALFSGAATLGKEPQFTNFIAKCFQLSMAMQNQATNDATVAGLADLVDKSLPVRFSGSVSFKDHFEFSGMYRFPQSDAAAVYGRMKKVIAEIIKTQAGEGKLYSEASFTEKHHTVAGVPVDRYSFKMNLDNPAFQQPGQKAGLEKMFPNGKLDVDYAVKNDRLLVATPQRMQSLIEEKSTVPSSSAVVPTDTTVAAGYFNIVRAMRDVAGSNPTLPAPATEKMSKLDANGTQIQFQLDMDSQIRIDSRIPIKLIQQLGKMH